MTDEDNNDLKEAFQRIDFSPERVAQLVAKVRRDLEERALRFGKEIFATRTSVPGDPRGALLYPVYAETLGEAVAEAARRAALILKRRTRVGIVRRVVVEIGRRSDTATTPPCQFEVQFSREQVVAVTCSECHEKKHKGAFLLHAEGCSQKTASPK